MQAITLKSLTEGSRKDFELIEKSNFDYASKVGERVMKVTVRCACSDAV